MLINCCLDMRGSDLTVRRSFNSLLPDFTLRFQGEPDQWAYLTFVVWNATNWSKIINHLLDGQQPLTVSYAETPALATVLLESAVLLAQEPLVADFLQRLTDLEKDLTPAFDDLFAAFQIAAFGGGEGFRDDRWFVRHD